MTKIRKFTIDGEEISAEIERIDGFLRIKIDDKVHDVLIEGQRNYQNRPSQRDPKEAVKKAPTVQLFHRYLGKWFRSTLP